MTKAAARAAGITGLSTSLTGSLDEQIQKLRGQIIERAYARAQSRAPMQPTAESSAETVAIDVSLQDVSAAFDEAVGQSYPQTDATVRTFSFFDIFSPFTCICFLLCIAFGGLGLSALKTADPKLATQASGFLDVAKIFAGALVGSTSSTALAAIKSRKRVS
jgi:hypothetical protein